MFSFSGTALLGLENSSVPNIWCIICFTWLWKSQYAGVKAYSMDELNRLCLCLAHCIVKALLFCLSEKSLFSLFKGLTFSLFSPLFTKRSLSFSSFRSLAGYGLLWSALLHFVSSVILVGFPRICLVFVACFGKKVQAACWMHAFMCFTAPPGRDSASCVLWPIEPLLWACNASIGNSNCLGSSLCFVIIILCCVMDWSCIQAIFLPCAQFSQDKLQMWLDRTKPLLMMNKLINSIIS